MNHYEVLEVASNATQSEIKTAYRKLVKRFHPDINPDPNAAARMMVINEAYEVLSDNTSRNLYDLFLQGVPVKTELKKDNPGQRYRKEYLRKKVVKDRDRIMYLVKIKTRFYKYLRLTNMIFFGIGVLFTLDYYYQPVKSVEEVEKVVQVKSHNSTRVVLRNGYRFNTAEEFYWVFNKKDANELVLKYSLLFAIPARVKTLDGKEDFIIDDTIYTFRNAFSIIILLFSSVLVKNKEYNDFRLSCGLVPGFLVLFLLLLIAST